MKPENLVIRLDESFNTPAGGHDMSIIWWLYGFGYKHRGIIGAVSMAK